MAKNIYEIFKEVEDAKNDADRKAILWYNRSYALESVLQGMFGHTQFFITEPVPFTPSDMPPGMSYSSIRAELDKSYLFIKDGPKVPPNLTENRRKQLLVQSLESLEHKEAIVYQNMFLKKNEVKGLTKEMVKEVFPHLWD